MEQDTGVENLKIAWNQSCREIVSSQLGLLN